MRLVHLCVLLLLTSLLLTSTAKAQSGLSSEQLRHFEAGRELVRQKRHAEAIPEFLAVTRDGPPSIGALLNLADCYERIGKYASAAERFREAEQLAKEKKDDREGVARAAATEIEARIPALTIRLKPTKSGVGGAGGAGGVSVPDGLRILLDGASIDVSRLGRPLPVDPGEHVLLATARGMRKVEQRITVTSKTDEASIELEKEESDPGNNVSSSSSSVPSSSRLRRTTGIVGLVTGGVLLVAGAVAFGLAASSKSDLDARCPAYPSCPSSATAAERQVIDDLNDRGRQQALLSTIGLIGGAVIAATGLVLVITTPSPPAPPPSPSSPSSLPRSAATTPSGVIVGLGASW
jgi:hypothetical protein